MLNTFYFFDRRKMEVYRVFRKDGLNFKAIVISNWIHLFETSSVSTDGVGIEDRACNEKNQALWYKQVLFVLLKAY